MVETVNFLTRTLVSSRLITRYGLRVDAGPSHRADGGQCAAGCDRDDGWHGPPVFLLTALTKLCDEVLWKSIDDRCFSSSINPYQRSSGLRSKLPMQGIMGPLAVALSGAILLLFGTMDSAIWGSCLSSHLLSWQGQWWSLSRCNGSTLAL